VPDAVVLTITLFSVSSRLCKIHELMVSDFDICCCGKAFVTDYIGFEITVPRNVLNLEL